jgi:aspartate racemase
MKTIGLIGGTTWFSTIDYYRFINQEMNKRLGGDTSAKIILHSVNYAEIARLTKAEEWDAIADIICNAAQGIERTGADCILVCANTMHHIADKIASAVNIPFIHIAEVTARAIHDKGIRSVLLLGTKYTMTYRFYQDCLAGHGIRTIIPGISQVEWVNDSIYNELGKGIFLPETKGQYQKIIKECIDKGAVGVIMGCTELPLLLDQADYFVPLFNTTSIHATAAVDFALQ